jgi:hypothetical protein
MCIRDRCDGGGGVLKALRDVWPSTRVQRCLFHVCMNITGPTGLRPRLEAGRRLRKVAVALSRVSDAATAAEWMASYNRWERDFAGFLDQKSRWEDGTVYLVKSAFRDWSRKFFGFSQGAFRPVPLFSPWGRTRVQRTSSRT